MQGALTSFHIARTALLAALTLVGCAVRPIEPAKSTASPLTTPSKASTSSNSPVQTPMAGLPNWDAKPASGKAILRGRVTVQSNFLLGELYLAKAVPTNNSNVDLIELDEKTAPRAAINRATGEFILMNVEPGKYGLVAWEPMNSIPINDPKTGHTLFVTLLADQVTDVGMLFVP